MAPSNEDSLIWCVITLASFARSHTMFAINATNIAAVAAYKDSTCSNGTAVTAINSNWNSNNTGTLNAIGMATLLRPRLIRLK